MVGRKCAVSPTSAVDAIVLFKDKVISSMDGEPRKYSFIKNLLGLKLQRI